MKFVLLKRTPLVLILSGLLAAGCANHSHDRYMSEEALAPKPPAFLTGATAALLTNSTGISTQLSLERPPGKPLTGTLLAWGSHLLFAPQGDRTFMWDVSTHSGYVVSESMQGYAPISAPAYVTGVVTKSETAGPSGSKINGEAGHLAEFTVTLSDGTHQDFSVWRSADWHNFPAQINPGTNSGGATINLTKFRRDPLTAAIFQPPAGYTPYGSLEAMTGEFMMRRSKVNTKAVIEHPDEVPLRSPQPAGGPSHY